MGSIYRPKYKDRHGQEQTSAVWWIQYYSRGRKIRVSTDTAEYSEAKDFIDIDKRSPGIRSYAPRRSGPIGFPDLHWGHQSPTNPI